MNARCIGAITSYTRQTCASICTAEGGTCTLANDYVICGSGFLPGAVTWDCATMPPTSCDSSGAGPQPFHSITCSCEF
jgi:hypothetical protein